MPRVRANLSSEYTLPVLPALTLIAGAYYTSREAVTTTDTIFVPSEAAVDLGFRYDLLLANRPVSARVYAQNIAGHSYWIASGNNQLSLVEPRAVSRNSPGAAPM